jgi:opacity protein-like surface antigen
MQKLLAAATILAASAALAPPVLAQGEFARYERQTMQLALSGGWSKFRLPNGGGLGPIPGLDPQSSTRTAGAGLSFGIFDHLAFEAAAHLTWGDSFTDDSVAGVDDPHTWTGTLGLRVPFPMARGRFVPYLGIGAGVYRRDIDDPAKRALADSLGVERTDPLGFAGGGLEWRFTRNVGIRGDYRYLRVFPEEQAGFDIERERFHIHRITGGLTLGF